MTWMMISTLCLQLSGVDAECAHESYGPYRVSKHCWERVKDQEAALEALADDLNAKVLFIGVTCRKGMDG